MAKRATNSFGDRLRQLREKAGISQYELAHRSGVSKQVINYLESGASASPRWDTAVALARALGVGVEEFDR